MANIFRISDDRREQAAARRAAHEAREAAREANQPTPQETIRAERTDMRNAIREETSRGRSWWRS